MSDGCSDAQRSMDIGELSTYILGAEMNFLTRPTKENLDYLFKCCAQLDKVNGIGYFPGESPKSIAKSASARYQKFKNVNDYKINLVDFANLLKRIYKPERIEVLANLIALESDDFGPFNKFYYMGMPLKSVIQGGEAFGISNDEGERLFKKYHETFFNSFKFIEDHFTITHKQIFEEDNFDEQKLEKILKESGVSEKFPSNFFS